MGIRVIVEEYDDVTGEFINDGVGVSEASDVNGAARAFLKAYADSSFVNTMKIEVNPLEDRVTQHTLFYNSHDRYYTLYYDDKQSRDTLHPLQKTYLDGWEDDKDDVHDALGYLQGVTDERLMVKPELLEEPGVLAVGGFIPDDVVLGMMGESPQELWEYSYDMFEKTLYGMAVTGMINIPTAVVEGLSTKPLFTSTDVEVGEDVSIDEVLDTISRMVQDGVAYKGLD